MLILVPPKLENQPSIWQLFALLYKYYETIHLMSNG